MLRLNIAIAVAPALFLLWLFKKWDEKRPEPAGAVRNCVLFGVATCVPAIGIELAESAVLGDLTNLQGGFVNAFLVAALTEEALKLAVVLLFLWRKPHFDEVMDGILYTAAASLGFALIENVLYSAGNPLTGMMRAFTAVPLHAVASGIMGYFVGRAKFAKGAGTLVWLMMGLSAAVAIHGTYDWVLMSQGGFGFDPNPIMQLSIFGILAVCGFILWRLVKHAHKLDDELLGSHARPLKVEVPHVVGPAMGQPAYAYAAAGQGYPTGAVGYAQPGYAQPGYAPQAGYAQPQPYAQPQAYGSQQQAYAPPQPYGQPQAPYPQPPPAAYAPQPQYAAPPTAPGHPATAQYAPPTQPYPPPPFDPRNPHGGQGGQNR